MNLLILTELLFFTFPNYCLWHDPREDNDLQLIMWNIFIVKFKKIKCNTFVSCSGLHLVIFREKQQTAQVSHPLLLHTPEHTTQTKTREQQTLVYRVNAVVHFLVTVEAQRGQVDIQGPIGIKTKVVEVNFKASFILWGQKRKKGKRLSSCSNIFIFANSLLTSSLSLHYEFYFHNRSLCVDHRLSLKIINPQGPKGKYFWGPLFLYNSDELGPLL